MQEKITAKASNEDLEKYGLTKETKKYHIEIYNAEGKRTLSFFIGKTSKNKGHYLLREGTQEVYLSKNSLEIDSSHKDFINRVLVDVDKDSVIKVLIHAGENMEIERREKEFALVNSKKEVKKDKLSNYISEFSSALFEDFFKPDEQKVQNVDFNKELHIQLNNKLNYTLKFAEKNGEYFVKAIALIPDIPNQVVINQDADRKELENVGNMLQAKQKADQFNRIKNSWIYLMDKNNYEKFIKKPSQFM